ncbi:PorT family protein [Dysgonomonadaceae bacterium zrk40]|nr:PorT family protein [Dysgonomonadaceae bacterium zrk40]
MMKTKKMIRTSLFILTTLMLTPTLFGQIRFGVKADVGLNNPSFDSEALQVENMTSYSIGPSLEAMFPFAVIDFGIEASLLYNDNRMTVSNLTDGESATTNDVSNRYLYLPLNAKIKFGLGMLPLRMYAVAGPYAGYLISGDGIDLEDMQQDLKAKEFQAGANIGLGLELFKMLQVGVNYGVQLTDNYAVERPNWQDPLNGKTETWSINATLYF